MIRKTSRAIYKIYYALLRIALIFLVLTLFADSTSRLYYLYSPITNWIDFSSVSVEMHNGQATAVITRTAHQRLVSLFHRTIMISYPENRRICTASSVTVMDTPEEDVIYVPLKKLLKEDCEQALKDGPVEGILQVSYIFNFPYNVIRAAVQHSNPFLIGFKNGDYEVMSPMHRTLRTTDPSPDRPFGLGLLPEYNEQSPVETRVR